MDWVAIAGTVVGAILGAAIGVLGTLKISRERRRHDQREDLRRAFGAYLGALYPAVAELRELPPVREQPRLVALLSRLESENVAWARQRQREYRLYGDRHRQNASALAAAVADLQVRPMPSVLRSAFERANDYIERLGEQRSPELRGEWEAIHAELMRGARSIEGWTPLS